MFTSNPKRYSASLNGISCPAFSPNSVIKIKVKRQNQELDFNITRETIEINPVPFYKMIDDEVGYIAFVKFNKKASSEVKSAFEDLKSQGMKKLIIDVRHNPGGLLGEAINIVNFFIPLF